MKITSLQNRRIKQIVKLRSRSRRDKQGVMLIEGRRALERALAADWEMRELYFCPASFADPGGADLVRRCAAGGMDAVECSEEVFRKIAYRDKPEGVLALGRQAGIELAALEIGPNPLLLVAEGVEKPGNLGGLLRIADGAGADAVIVADGRTDTNNPNVVRSSVGTIFSMPIAEAGSVETLQWLRERDIATLAAMPAADCVYTGLDMRSALAVVIGAERPGLSALWKESATYKARIPMCGRGDSLNLSISAAILLYEAVRQRENQ